MEKKVPKKKEKQEIIFPSKQMFSSAVYCVLDLIHARLNLRYAGADEMGLPLEVNRKKKRKDPIEFGEFARNGIHFHSKI